MYRFQKSLLQTNGTIKIVLDNEKKIETFRRTEASKEKGLWELRQRVTLS